jgi:hypothetical protein
MNIAKHYFECHVTIEPIFDEKLDAAKLLAQKFGFKIASLLMKKRETETETRSKYDTFMTAHDKDLGNMKLRLTHLVHELKVQKFKIWRYKIEDTVMDSRIKDEMELLDAKTCNT